MDETLYLFQLESELVNREHIQEKSNILTLSHLQTAFYILFIGLGVSLGSFVGEVYVKRREEKSKKFYLNN